MECADASHKWGAVFLFIEACFYNYEDSSAPVQEPYARLISDILTM